MMIISRITLIIPLFLSFSLHSTAQETDTVKVFKSDPRHQKLVAFIPGAVAVTYGFVALNSNWFRKLDYHIYEKLNERHPGYHTAADDYMRYVPAAAVYGLDLLGIKGRNNFRDKTALLLISATLTSGSLQILKASSNRMRPSRLNDYSFPSGHTAMAFAGAEFLHQEYGESSIWYSVGGYGVATATGILRMYKNAHWFSDVVAGAGLGILSTKFAYFIYPSIQKIVTGKKTSNFTMLPVYQNQAMGVAISGKF